MRIGPTFALALASCGPVLGDDDTGAVSDTGGLAETDTSEVAGPADFRETGPYAVTTTTGTLTTTSGCDLDWTFVQPAEWDVLVVLLHGWLRSRAQQVSGIL